MGAGYVWGQGPEGKFAMSLTVFASVMLAAILHASWNALVKGADDKLLSMAGVVLGHVPIALAVLLFVPLPAFTSLPYLVIGAGLHFGYQVFLLNSYRIGDLSQVYPIARGTAPLLVAGFSILVLGVDLSATELLAILIIGGSILSLSVVRNHDGLRNGRAALMAFGTGCFIASYSLVDGLGAREAGTALGFYALLTLLNGVAMAVFVTFTDVRVFRRLPTVGRRVMIIGGTASFVAYGLVMWAFTQAPIALVTALRETSIIVALLIGVIHFKEKLNLAKLAAVLTTLLGVILLRSSR